MAVGLDWNTYQRTHRSARRILPPEAPMIPRARFCTPSRSNTLGTRFIHSSPRPQGTESTGVVRSSRRRRGTQRLYSPKMPNLFDFEYLPTLHSITTSPRCMLDPPAFPSKVLHLIVLFRTWRRYWARRKELLRCAELKSTVLLGSRPLESRSLPSVLTMASSLLIPQILGDGNG